MRLVFLISTLEMGGAQRVAAALVRHWVEIGYEVSVIVTFSGTSRCHYELPPQAEVIYLVDEAGRNGGFFASKVGRLVVLRRLFARLRPDAVVAFMLDANLAAILATFGRDVPLLVSERSYPPREQVPFIYRLLRRLTYPRATAVVFPTSAGVDWLRSHIPRARGAMIPNPAMFPIPDALPRAEIGRFVDAEAKVVLTVGRLVPGKGHDELIQAFARVQDRFPEWRLVIAGDGPNRATLEALAVELGLRERVAFPGAVGNIGDWYERAEVFVLSSHFEGFPNVLVEAMSHGCACISYDCDTGPREIIVDFENGVLVRKVGDVTELAAAVADVLGDVGLRERISGNAVAVRDTYSMGTIQQRWDALITSRRPAGTV